LATEGTERRKGRDNWAKRGEEGIHHRGTEIWPRKARRRIEVEVIGKRREMGFGSGKYETNMKKGVTQNNFAFLHPSIPLPSSSVPSVLLRV